MTSIYQSTDYTLLFRILLDLLLRPSPSGQEELVRSYVVARLQECGFEVKIDAAGNVLATRGKPEASQGYPLLSFHMDTVEDPIYSYPVEGRPTRKDGESDESFKKRKRSHYFARRQVLPPSLRPASTVIVEQGWIRPDEKRVAGGDDKCGGAITLALAAHTTMPLKVVASVEEEAGCVGIHEVEPGFFADVSYALVLDRREGHDLITEINGRPICTRAFISQMVNAAAAIGHTVRPTPGMLSDAVVLARYIWDVVNMSVGYHHPHTELERISLDEVRTAYDWAYQALLTLPLPEPTPVVTIQPDLSKKLQKSTRPSYLKEDPEVIRCTACDKWIIAPELQKYSPILAEIACKCDESSSSDKKELSANESFIEWVQRSDP
jgi:di/tripeptidase